LSKNFAKNSQRVGKPLCERHSAAPQSIHKGIKLLQKDLKLHIVQLQHARKNEDEMSTRRNI